MHCLSQVYFVSQRLHFSGIFVAYHQEIYSIYATVGKGKGKTVLLQA